MQKHDLQQGMTLASAKLAQKQSFQPKVIWTLFWLLRLEPLQGKESKHLLGIYEKKQTPKGSQVHTQIPGLLKLESFQLVRRVHEPLELEGLRHIILLSETFLWIAGT